MSEPSTNDNSTDGSISSPIEATEKGPVPTARTAAHPTAPPARSANINDSGSSSSGSNLGTAQRQCCRYCRAVASSKAGAALLRCSRCRLALYCSAEHQRLDWRDHRRSCNDQYRADQHTLHKREFDRIVKKYGLDSAANAEAISTFLTSSTMSSKEEEDGPPKEDGAAPLGAGGGVSAREFADKFGIDNVQEAVVFLEWINVGVRFKEQTMDAAKRAGFGPPAAGGGKEKGEGGGGANADAAAAAGGAK
jgi:MYND finger